jgi:microcystin-dependent protein
MKKLLLLSLICLSQVAQAGVPYSFTYQGKVLNSAGTAPLTSVVSLLLSIYDPTGTCLLYQEQQANIDLSQTNGTFAVQVGSATGSSKRTLLDQGLSLPLIFANNGAILNTATSNCTAGYTPGTNDIRVLRVAVTTGGSTVTISPDLQINAVPNAMVAETLQGQNLTQVMEPAGSLLAFAGPVCPTGYLNANGASVTKSLYSNLFNAIGYSWGGTGANFNLPDLRGRFIRGQDQAAGNDPDRLSRTASATGGNSGDAVGSLQADAFQGHAHPIGFDIGTINNGSDAAGNDFNTMAHGTTGLNGTWNAVNSNAVSSNFGAIRVSTETRSKNVNALYCVKY